MEQYNIQQEAGFSNKENVLNQIDPRATIEDLKLHFLGLRKTYIKDGTMTKEKVIRISKPMFTYEFVQNNLSIILSSKLNFTVQVSRFEKVEISRRIAADDKRLVELFTEHGVNNYISDEQWDRILELHDNKIPVEDEDGNITYQTYWERKGIKWSYDKPVDSKMLKQTYFNNNEYNAVFSILSQLRSLITTISFASFNKSYSDPHAANGMMVSMLGEVRKESSIMRETPKKNSFFNRSRGDEE